MKDCGIYAGSGSSVILTKLGMGEINIHVFHWWELLLIACFFLLIAIAGGVAGMAFQELINLNKGNWIGKRKAQRPSS